jgi:hypothetical protein
MLLQIELHYLNLYCPPNLLGQMVLYRIVEVYILFYSHVSYDEFKSICKKTV